MHASRRLGSRSFPGKPPLEGTRARCEELIFLVFVTPGVSCCASNVESEMVRSEDNMSDEEEEATQNTNKPLS